MKNTLIQLLLAIVMLACTSREAKETHHAKLKVVATTSILYDAVKNVGGEQIDATSIMGPGVDPHLYKASQGDLQKFIDADVIFYNGLLLEGKLSEVLEKMGRQKPVVGVAEVIPKEELLTDPNYEDAHDPHIWFDIRKWKIVIKQIEQTLTAIDSVNRNSYKKNTEQYLAKLDSLETYVSSRINEIPDNQRILITAHDAFGYFGQAYAIKVEGLQGISTVSDFGLRDIADLIDLILENQIKAIFIETSVSSKSIDAVIEGCKNQGYELSLGGVLYSDATGEFGTEEGTYIGMFRKNVDTIVEALK